MLELTTIKANIMYVVENCKVLARDPSNGVTKQPHGGFTVHVADCLPRYLINTENIKLVIISTGFGTRVHLGDSGRVLHITDPS